METTKLLEDIRRVQKSVSRGRFKGKNETKGDFIKKKNRFTCVYCQSRTENKKLRTSVERFHIVKHNDSIRRIADHYQTTAKKLQEINEHLNVYQISKGDFLKLDTDFKVFPNTHGICYCDKCATDRQQLKMSHVDYLNHILKKRKESRNSVDRQLRDKVFKRDNFECVYCIKEHGEAKPDRRLTIDHKKPIVAGGTSTEDNLCASCQEHNLDKGKMNYDDYLKKIKERKFLKENSFIHSEI